HHLQLLRISAKINLMTLFPKTGARSARLIAAAAIYLAASRGNATASAPTPAPHVAARRGSVRPRPGSSVPIITLTSSATIPRALETRMAQFILSLQANDRAAAARL